jgi:hypothetical protein
MRYDAPEIDSPAIRETASAIADVYRHHSAGGNLHSRIDDWNLDDVSDLVDYCQPTSPEQWAAERRCLDLMRGLTEIERASALGLYEGYWEPDRWERPGDWPEVNGLVED